MVVKARALVAAGVLLACSAAAPLASAQSLDRAGMEAEMDTYFGAERTLGLAGMIAGTASLGGAAVLYTRDDDFFKGAAYPVAGFGLLQLVAGSVIFFRTPGQVDDLKSQLRRDEASFRRDELDRMKRVNDQFDVLTIVWIVGVAAGLGTATYGFIDDSDTAKGIGAGVTLQTAVFLAGDLVAAGNARDYTNALQRFTPGSGGSSSAPLVLTVGGSF